jgi:hypothetical protein
MVWRDRERDPTTDPTASNVLAAYRAAGDARATAECYRAVVEAWRRVHPDQKPAYGKAGRGGNPGGQGQLPTARAMRSVPNENGRSESGENSPRPSFRCSWSRAARPSWSYQCAPARLPST